MLKTELANKKLGVRDMFFFYAKQKMKESQAYSMKRDYRFQKDVIYENVIHKKEIDRITEEKEFFEEWYKRLCTQKETEELDYLDKQEYEQLPYKIERKQQFIDKLNATKMKVVYLDYTKYTDMIKFFNLRMQEYICQGYPVVFKKVGLFVLVEQYAPKKVIDWKATKERKKEYLEKGITDSAYVYYNTGTVHKLIFIKPLVVKEYKNAQYYKFKICGGQTKKDSKSFTFKIHKRIKELVDVTYWKKIDGHKEKKFKQEKMVRKLQTELSSIDTSTLLF